MYDLTGVESCRTAAAAAEPRRRSTLCCRSPRPSGWWPRSFTRPRTRSRSTAGCRLDLPIFRCGSAKASRCILRRPTSTNAKGWRPHRAPNMNRLEQFGKYLSPAPQRVAQVADCRRQADARRRIAVDAYAEALGPLTYYLIRHRPKQYLAYLQMLADKKPLLWDDPQARLKEFQAAFGDNLGQLDTDFFAARCKKCAKPRPLRPRPRGCWGASFGPRARRAIIERDRSNHLPCIPDPFGNRNPTDARTVRSNCQSWGVTSRVSQVVGSRDRWQCASEQFARGPWAHAGGSDTLKLGLIGCGGRGSGAVRQRLGGRSECQVRPPWPTPLPTIWREAWRG